MKSEIHTIFCVALSHGQSTQLHYLSQSIDTPGQILLQDKWKLFSQILLELKYWSTYF